MTLRQLSRLASLLNGEPSRSIATLQILETIDRNTTGTRRKLQQSALLLGVPAADTLPELLDDFVVLCVATVVGVLLPVVDVNVCNSSYQKLQFSLIENVNEISWYQFVKASDKGVELFLNAFLDSPLRYKPVDVSVMLSTHIDATYSI